MNRTLDNQFDPSVTGWFLTLRWGTVLCQVILFAAVRFLFAMTVPVLVLWLIAFEVASNFVFAWLIREEQQVPSPLATGVMFLDIALLTALLGLTGGALNPFTFLYLVHIVVGAILLPRGMAWCLAAFASACYGSFFWPGFPIPGIDHQSMCHDVVMPSELSLHLQGMWVAFVITAFFVVFFVTRIQQALVARREIQAQLREEQCKNARLASLATLSASAAHEFATPLSTIAVAAGELYREMRQTDYAAWLDDLQLIRSQVNRCRDILYQMAADAGEPMGESKDTLTIDTLVDEIRASLDEHRQDRLIMDCSDVSGTLITVPQRSIKRVIRGLISNAFHASDAKTPVRLKVTVDQGAVRFEVSDRGRGMDRETVKRAREPFFTTRPAGQGLGLGLYLAGILAERLDGGLTIDSAPGIGTTVGFWIKAL